MRSRVGAIAGLTVLWLLLWGELTPVLLVGGVLVAVLVTTVFPFPQAEWEGAFRPVAFVVLVSRFVADLVVASLQVSWLVLRPRPLGPSAVVAVQLHTRSELLLAITCELVSLVPGSLLIELDPDTGTAWLHVLDADRDLDGVVDRVHAQERRVIAALGSDAERAAYCDGSIPAGEVGP